MSEKIKVRRHLREINNQKMLKISVKRPIGYRISDIGAGGKEYNVKEVGWKNGQISFGQFRKETFHKKVKYTYTNLSGIKKVFEVDKFYANPLGKSDIVTPKFIMARASKFFKINNNLYLATNEFGETEFEVSE